MEEARHCKARSATLARSSSEKLGAVLQRDIIIVINVLTQRGLIVLVSRFISPSRWIVKSLTKRDIYKKKKKYKKTRSYLEPILLRTPLSILRVTNNHGIRNDRIEEEEEEEEGCLIFVSTRNNFTRMMIGGVWKGRDDHFLSLRPLSTRARKKGGGRWEGKAGRKFSRYTVYIEQATTFDEARRPTSARILAICAVHRPVPRQRVAQFTFRTYLATKRATDFYGRTSSSYFIRKISLERYLLHL